MPVQLPNKRGNCFPTRGTLRAGHIDRTTSDGGRVLSTLLLEACFASLQAFAASLCAGRTQDRIEKPLKRLCTVEKPTTPCPRNPVLSQARLDRRCLGDLQQKSRKIVVPLWRRTAAFAYLPLVVASGDEAGVSHLGGVTAERSNQFIRLPA